MGRIRWGRVTTCRCRQGHCRKGEYDMQANGRPHPERPPDVEGVDHPGDQRTSDNRGQRNGGEAVGPAPAEAALHHRRLGAGQNQHDKAEHAVQSHQPRRGRAPEQEGGTTGDQGQIQRDQQGHIGFATSRGRDSRDGSSRDPLHVDGPLTKDAEPVFGHLNNRGRGSLEPAAVDNQLHRGKGSQRLPPRCGGWAGRSDWRWLWQSDRPQQPGPAPAGGRDSAHHCRLGRWLAPPASTPT